jgi:DNA-binding CsgD family transcriptional regulator
MRRSPPQNEKVVSTTLVGRDREIGALRDLVDRARSGSGAALVVRGEPGVGKTVLLDELEGLAHDFQIIRAEGIESEVKLGYAALHRILRPFLNRTNELSSPQRDAVEAAFGLRETGRSDQFLVGLAALTLMGDPERDAPLLVIVDDAHWLDDDSLIALAFVGRRLQADGVALVFAAREWFVEQGSISGLPELLVTGLAEAPARELLASLAATPVNKKVAKAIVDATAGNPLALTGLAQELTESQLAGMSPLPDPLPTSGLIEARFARQVRLLPRETQIALLLAAAEPTQDLAVIDRAAKELGTSVAALEPAEALRLITTGSGIAFRHPLIRSAVYSSAPSALRRKAHLALASAVGRADSERWTTHRALAALGPDDELAQALEESAVLARARGGYTAETVLLSRSAELSPGSRDRSRRFLAAAQAANLAGNPAQARALLETAGRMGLDESDRARAQLLDGLLSVSLGNGSRAPALLLEAAKSLSPLELQLSRRALLASLSALQAASHCAEGATGVQIGEMALASLEHGAGDPTIDSLLRGVASVYARDYQTAVTALRSALVTFQQMPAESIAEWRDIGPFITNALWDPDARKVVTALLDTAAREHGSILALQPTLLASAAERLREGRFSEARALHSELLEITKAVGGLTFFYALLDAELVAWEGEGDVARTKINQLIETATALGSGGSVLHGFYSMSILELGLCRYSEALTAARTLEDAGMPAWSSFWLPQVVEAGMRCAEIKIATEALEQIEEQAHIVQTPYALGMMWRCRALVWENDQGETSFNKALEHIGKSPWRTEVARTHLLFGEWLRREKRRADARVELRTAHEMFQTMGAGAFAERARLELEATGERARPRSVQSPTELTVRELQIARLAGDGLTSREIASQLFISPHTVEYHLTKVFQKLGVRSRRYLAKALPVNTQNGS